MSEELKGQVRHLFTTLGGVLATVGVINTGYIEMIAGVGVALAGFAWSWWSKRSG